MPISPLTLQRRFAELGRIRLGAKQGGKGRPMKLTAFRFTSPNKRYIDDLAALYGGDPVAWDNGGKPEFEVFTDATSIPVIAMKGGLSQWMETWSGGGCTHRCDGETNAATGERCDPEDRLHQQAKPTTRLSLMLPELEAIGAWRMESHGWNAAAELPNVVELAQFVGDLVPAHLTMIERRSVKDGQTSRFVVPVLDLQIGTARLREIVAEKSGTAPALEGGTSAPAIEAPKTDDPARYSAYFDRLSQAATLEALTEIWNEMLAAGLVGANVELVGSHAEFVDRFKATAAEIRAAAAPAAAPDAEGVVDAEVVEDQPAPAAPGGAEPDADTVWQRILAATGEAGWQLADVEEHFASQMGGLSSAEASAAELQTYLTLVTQRLAAEQVPA